MKIITELEEANNLLQKYAGSKLQIYMYSPSLKRIALKLELANKAEQIFLIGIGCKSMYGCFEYSSAKLNIDYSFEEDINEKITLISDKNNGFSLETSGGFSIAYGLDNEFGTSFENFLNDSK